MPKTMGSTEPSASGATAPAQATAGVGAGGSPSHGDVVAVPSTARGAADAVASRTASADAESHLLAAPSAARAAAPTVSAPSATKVSAMPETIVQTISPRPKAVEQANQTSTAASIPSTWPSPQPAAAGRKTVDILDLPPAPKVDSQSSAGFSTGVLPVSATEQVRAPADGRYAHDADYGRLRGRLEYSQIDRAWRLRYIPIDGATDAYGGSVVLSRTPKLSGLERGDFVEVHGRLLPPREGGTTYAAGYELQDIRRL